MKKLLLLLVFVWGASVYAQHPMESLDRGLVAVKVASGVFVGWTLPGEEWHTATYNLYRDGQKVNDAPLGVSNFVDPAGTLGSRYAVAAVVNGVEQAASEEVAVWQQQYKELSLDLPPGGVTPDGEAYSYTVNDMSTGHLNDDDVLDLVVKWEALGRDNSHAGYTGNVILDAYTMEGEKLWRIDLGKNIRAGAHYTQFMVYDLNGDGIAEIACKTAPGTVDGLGNFLSKGPAATANHSADYRNAGGYVLSGPEYLTVFDGRTGAELSTVAYHPPRGNVDAWGDGYGNRVDRFLAAVAYLDGERPSLVMTRGYYTRSVLSAYDFDGNELSLRWVFDSDTPGNAAYAGQGNHNLSVADVDGDGRDEIVFGSCTIDDDGTGLYSTRLGHGDAMHVSDFDPYRPGLEVFRCLESGEGGSVLHDAADGSILIRHRSFSDCGRCMAANISNETHGAQVWGCSPVYSASSRDNVDHLGLHTSVNFRIFWDGDLLSELLDHTRITKPSTGQVIFDAPGGLSNNGTKGTPALQADLFGDWREELIYRTNDPSKIRIYTTVHPTEHRVYSLMHDRQYRLAVAWQNVAYNQPPHPSFFLGELEGITAPPPPKMNNRRHVYHSGAEWDKTTQGWMLDGAAVSYEDGSHVYFTGGESREESLLLNASLAPSFVTVNTAGSFKLNGDGGSLGGEMGLVKQGSGTFLLKGQHSFTGVTELWEGTLALEGHLSASPVWANFSTRLGVAGDLGAGLTLRRGAQLLVGGESQAGNTTVSGPFVVEEKAELVFDMNGLEVAERDLLTINGEVDWSDETVVRVNAKLVEGLAAGTYVLIDFPEGISGTTGTLVLKGIEGLPAELSWLNDQLVLTVKEVRAVGQAYWKGSVNDEWDLVKTENFLVEGTASYFVTGDEVVVDDAAVSKTIQLVETLMPASVLFDNETDYVLTGNGKISGTASLTKQGSGKLSLQNINDFSGKITVEEGVLEVFALPNAIDGHGSIGGVSSNAGLFEINGATLRFAQAGTAERAMTVGNEGAVLHTDASVSWNGRIIGGSVEKTGVHTLSLSAANTNQELVLKQGAVQLTTEQALPGQKVVFEGGVLRDFDSGGSYSSSSYPLVVEEGQVGTLYADGRCTYSNTLTGAGEFRISIPWVRSDFAGNWSDFSGTIRLMTDNSFRNYSTHGYAQAILDLGTTGVFDDMLTQTVRLGALTGSGRLWGAAAWELGHRNEDFSFGGTITSGNVIKVGSGVMQINADLQSSGSFVIREGGVLVNGGTSGTGSSAVTVKAGAYLSGNGRIQGNIIVENEGVLYAGYYAPETPVVGSSFRTTNVRLSPASHFVVQVDLAANRSDRMSASGNFVANGVLEMRNVSVQPYEAGMSFQLVRMATISGGFTSVVPESPGEGLAWDLSTFTSDGTIRVAAATSIPSAEAVGSFKVYPNPGKGLFQMELPGGTGAGLVHVENLQGQLIRSVRIPSGEKPELDLSSLGSGVYVLHLYMDGLRYSTKVVVL